MIIRARKLLCLGFIGFSMVACLLDVRPSYGQEIWFSPRSGPGHSQDFYRLFESGAPWKKAASHLKAFELSIQLETGASDEELKKVIDGLRGRQVALALDMLPLTGRGDRVAPNGCGFHVEGYAASLQSLSVAQHFKALGADVVYFDMDEPLYYGHFFNGVNACHSSIDELIADVAEKVKQLRSQFPDVKIGDAEPIIAVTKFGLADLEKWLDAFQVATGERLSFLRLDIDWTAQWQPQVIAVAQLLKRKGVDLQVIYNGSDRDKSDEEWTSRAVANANAFEAAVKPDAVVIQSWAAYPKHVLPETDPTTMTGLINQYLSMRSLH
jgi:hypothetical protein